MEENNKLIAEFMDIGPDKLAVFSPQYRYHISWDWLVSVLHKIGEILDKNDYIYKKAYAYFSNNNLTELNIEDAYEEVVNFIIWYNRPENKEKFNRKQLSK